MSKLSINFLLLSGIRYDEKLNLSGVVMEQLNTLFAQHISELNARAKTIMARENIKTLIIHSGQPRRQFLDDMDYPFKVNPHFKAWLPVISNPHCWLIIDGVNKPTVVFYRPVDFWHKVPDEPNDFWTEQFEIVYLKKPDQIADYLPHDLERAAYIGEHIEVAEILNIGLLNPEELISYCHYHRAYKTDYEMHCLRQANKIAALGHQAAKAAFFAQQSEYDIQVAYLKATRQTENEVPYGNIIALNNHGAILHYTVLEQEAPAQFNSFLIDAGANFNGYASDITRSYSFDVNDEFSQLISALNQKELAIIEQVKPGVSYVDLHVAMHRLIAELLEQFDFVRLPAADIVEKQITSTFFPHGLGHFLGLQVHDVGGFMADERGTHLAAPVEHPFLRCTRVIAARHVLTIEPGLYFIDSLLDELKLSDNSDYINWDKIERFNKFGGIRIEDNIIVHQGHIENMTRDAGIE